MADQPETGAKPDRLNTHDTESGKLGYEPRWTLGGGKEGDRSREAFERNARLAMVALGLRFNDPDEAVDKWLDRVFAYYEESKARRLWDAWTLKGIVEGSAEYCEELATRCHEAGNLDSEQKLTALAGKFRGLLEKEGAPDIFGFRGGEICLPELSESAMEELARKWNRRLAQSLPSGPDWRIDSAVDKEGIQSSVTLAEGRFSDLSEKYWLHWLSSGDGHESFVGLLDRLKRQVSAEVASVWAGGPKSVEESAAKPAKGDEDEDLYDRVLRPVVEKALSYLVGKWGSLARGEELKRLGRGAQPEGESRKPTETDAVPSIMDNVLGKISNARPKNHEVLDPKLEPRVNGRDEEKAERAKIRSAWLDHMLAQHKKWTSDTDIADNGGPTYNTIQRYRSGVRSTRARYVCRRIADAFKCEITEVPE
jgi:hypothetical protein